MAEKKVLFSQAFRGYRRRDVNEYILSENRLFEAKEEAFSAERKNFEAMLSEKDDQIRSGEERIRELENALRERDELFSAIEKSLEDMRTEAKLLGREKEDELKRLEEAAAADRLAHEAEIARIRCECNAELEKNDADLEKIREEYRQKEEKRYDEVVSAAYRLRDKMAVELRRFTKNCLREVMSGVDSLRSGIDRTAEDAESDSRRMNKSIDAYEEHMKNEVRRILDEFKNGELSPRD